MGISYPDIACDRLSQTLKHCFSFQLAAGNVVATSSQSLTNIMKKNYTRSLYLLTISLYLFSSVTVFAATDRTDDGIDVITVTGGKSQKENIELIHDIPSQVDLGRWLKSVVGAEVNANGPITGIAQYRGLFGDRVAVSVDNQPVIGAGPNAMDSPLSYSSPLITESLEVYRGIAPVSAAIDTLGGAVRINLIGAELTNESQWTADGEIQAGYTSNEAGKTFGGILKAANRSQAIVIFGDSQSGDDASAGNGSDIVSTVYDKKIFGLGYELGLKNGSIGLNYSYHDTKNSGTPALPMDITFIDTDRFSIDGNIEFGRWILESSIGYTDAKHAMDNFSLRLNNVPAAFRRNDATAETVDFRVSLETDDWLFGIDGYDANHDAVITNPDNPMFRVVNFNEVEDRRLGVFIERNTQTGESEIHTGARIKKAWADAGSVSHHMAMMNPAIGELVQKFNNSDRSTSDSGVDLVLQLKRNLGTDYKLIAGTAFKTRAASYQERYLWFPLQSTGGLADGKTYIGDIRLDQEKSLQAEFGFDHSSARFYASPRIFYQRIEDYIQGTPVTDPVTIMVGMMMGDPTPLQFSNVDAHLYGLDMRWHYRLSDSFKLKGTLAYVRGERRDIKDDLYRIAPLNADVTLQYTNAKWNSAVIWRVYDKQDHVSATNNEVATAGYSVLGLTTNYSPTDKLTIQAGVENLLDKYFLDHLSGYSRVVNSDIPLGTRIPGTGRSLWVSANFRFQ